MTRESMLAADSVSRGSEPEPAINGPVLVRLAGLPGDLLGGADVGPLGEITCDDLEGDLTAARERWVEALHARIGGCAIQADRRAFLRLKRDAHNGRPLKPLSASLRAALGPALPAAEEVARLEAEVSAAVDAARERFDQISEQEGERLLALSEAPDFRRALTLASPAIDRALKRRRAKGRAGQRRKERKLRESLLRYATRAAFKLSPFSTFTRLGLGTLAGRGSEAIEAGVEFCAADWSERSLLRFDPVVLEQWLVLLGRNREVRRGRRVMLNETVSEQADGRLRWLRPAGWRLDEEKGSLRFRQDALVTARLDGPIIEWIRERLGRGEVLGALEDALFARFEQADPGTLDSLIEVGFLLLQPVWGLDASRAEVALARWLEHTPAVPEALRAEVGQLAELLGGSPLPKDSEALQRIGKLTARIDRGMRRSAGLEEERQTGHHCFEDVFVERPGQPEAPLLEADASVVSSLLDSAQPVFRLAAFFRPQLDFHLTMAASLKQAGYGAGALPLLEVYPVVQALWRDFRRFEIQHRQADLCPQPFNPLALAEIDELHALRSELWESLRDSFRGTPEGWRVGRAVVESLAARLPASASTGVGPCLFVQPAAGGAWVLNRMFEGTGRYGSRFTPVMPPELRQEYCQRAREAAHNDERGELLDLICSRGGLLGVHATQTQRSLTPPGEFLTSPAAERIGLGELFLQRGADLAPWQLVDGDGQRLCPAHLGTLDYFFLPLSVQFLSLFGPGQISLVVPNGEVERVGDVRRYGRILLDDLVLKRQRWVVPVAGELESLISMSSFEAHRGLQAWRRRLQLPRRVFVLERIDHQVLDTLHKPQFIDFNSPACGELFLSMVEKAAGTLTLEEMSPTPEDFPSDAAGRPWAVELCIDSLLLDGGSQDSQEFRPKPRGFDHQPGSISPSHMEVI